MTDDTPPQQTEEADDFLAPAPTVSTMIWVGPLVGTQWSATPIDAPLAPSQVPSEKTTQHSSPWPQGASSQTLRPFFS